MQGAGIVARGGDRVVADAVAVGAGGGLECGLDDSLTTAVAERLRQRCHHVVETCTGDGDGFAQLLDFVVVLDQAQLGEQLCQFGIPGLRGLEIGLDLGASEVDDSVDAGVGLSDEAHGDRSEVLRDGVIDGGGALRGDAGHGGHGFEVGARSDPVLAVAGIREELLGIGSGTGAEVQRHVVAVTLGFEDENGVGLGIGFEAGEVDERGMSAEAVVGVVRADLESAGGDDEPFARECCRDGLAARRGEAGCCESLGVEGSAIPSGGDEVAEGGGIRAMRAVVDAVCEVLSRVWGI